MIVLDSSALVAILKAEPEADEFQRIIAANSCLLSAVSHLETSQVLISVQNTVAGADRLEGLLTSAGIQIVAFDQAQAVLARDAFVRFGKGRHPAKLNLGDCAAYALAMSRGLPLLFKGADFALTDVTPAR